MRSTASPYRSLARPLTVSLAVAATGFALAAPGATSATPEPSVKALIAQDTKGKTQLVQVNAPTKKQRDHIIAMGFDATEAATRQGIDVVLHSQADADRLAKLGYTWKVKVADLAKQAAADNAEDAAYAADGTPALLPSGRKSYRYLSTVNDELMTLAAKHPNRVKLIKLKNPTVAGRPVWGIEVTHGAKAVNDGKPILLMMGAHHVREWPSVEHTMEFAYDLLKNDGEDARATQILDDSRVIFVPVVNPDGYIVSRSASPLGDFSLFDYEMKRKNCAVSVFTDPGYRGGRCADNPAGRLRGTDPNRNYPGFWGGPGASPFWSSDTFRGDAPGSEPEVDNIRHLVSTRQVTTLITNHTYSNLILRPPAIADTGAAPDEPLYGELGAMMAEANGYTNEPSYQLYDTSGGTEDWTYWNTGSLGFTFEIGTEGFHPPYRDGVVAEYLGLAPAAGEGLGGNREAYYRMAVANSQPEYHGLITGTAPRGHTLTISKRFVSQTSPVVNTDGTVGDPIEYSDWLRSSYASKGGAFTWATNPSTRPVVQGRGGRDPLAPAQPGTTLVNPPGIPAEDAFETATFTVQGLPDYDNARARVRVEWPDASVDWDVVVVNSFGEIVASAESLADPEIAVLIDPVPGDYTVVVINYEGGSADSDWSGSVSFENPTPAVDTGVREQWTLTCKNAAGTVVASQMVLVERGETTDVGEACVEGAGRRKG